MVSIQGAGSGGAGFDYVQDPSPEAPEEGEEWYDTGSNRAFVYDGSNWIEQTIGSHDELSNVTSSQHHSRYTDGEASDAAPVQSVNGRTGAVETVAYHKSFTEGNITDTTSQEWFLSQPVALTYLRLNCGGYGQGTVELTFTDGGNWSDTLGNLDSGGAEREFFYEDAWHGKAVDRVWIEHEDDGNASSSSTTARLCGVQMS